MCPLPDVSSARTTLPAGSRRTSPSLVSNSTWPDSQRTSKRCGGLCQSTSPIPDGNMADVAPRSRKIVRKAKWRIILEKCTRLEGYFEVFHMSFAACIRENSKTHHAVVVMPSIVNSSHRHLSRRLGAKVTLDLKDDKLKAR
jgi:hypothetical protein